MQVQDSRTENGTHWVRLTKQ